MGGTAANCLRLAAAGIVRIAVHVADCECVLTTTNSAPTASMPVLLKPLRASSVDKIPAEPEDELGAGGRGTAGWGISTRAYHDSWA